MPYNKKSILITGATGFIGKHLVKALVSKGYYCRCLVRETSNIGELEELDNIELVYGDLTNKASLETAIQNIQILYHLAAQVGKTGIPESQFYAINLQGTRNLLEASLQTDVEQCVFCSTPGVQGKGYPQASEGLSYNPPYIYERTKCEAEKLMLEFHRDRNLRVTIIRPDFVYGPGDLRRLSLYRAIKKQRFLIVGDGRSFVHPTYIDDVVQGCLLVLDNPDAFGEIFNIAGPRLLTIEEYVETIAGLLNVKIPRFKIPRLLAILAAFGFEAIAKLNGKEPFVSRSKVEFLTNSHGSDISKAKNQLGYYPNFEFGCGMRNTIEWYYNHGLL